MAPFQVEANPCSPNRVFDPVPTPTQKPPVTHETPARPFVGSSSRASPSRSWTDVHWPGTMARGGRRGTGHRCGRPGPGHRARDAEDDEGDGADSEEAHGNSVSFGGAWILR